MQNNNNNYTYTYDEDEIDLKEIFSVIARYKWFITIITLLFTLGAGIFAYYKPNIYKATSSIEVGIGKRSSFGGNDFLTAAMVGDVSSNNLDTEIAVIKSRKIILDAMQNIDMTTHIWGVNRFHKKIEIYKNSPFNIIVEDGEELEFFLTPKDDKSFLLEVKVVDSNGKEFEYKGIHSFNKQINTKYFTIKIVKRENSIKFKKYIFIKYNKLDSANSIKNNLIISPLNRRANIINISVLDTVPNRAKEFSNELARVYMKQNIIQKTDEASKILNFINSQLNTIKQNLDNSAKKLEEFQVKNKIINISEDVQKISTILSDYESKKSVLDMQINILNQLSKQIKRGRNLSSLTLSGIGVDDGNIATTIAKLQEILIKKKELSKDYTNQHPEIRALNAQISQLKSIIYKSIQSISKILKTKRDLLSKNIIKYQGLISKLPESQRRYLALERNFSLNEKFYSYLLEKKTETEIKKASTISQNRILDLALLPKYPIKPKKKLIVIIGFILGVILAIVLVFIREFLDDTIKSLSELEKYKDIPVLGSVAHYKAGKKERLLISVKKPKSSVAESFRSIRTNVQFLLTNKTHNIIAVTSTIAGEGKTSIAANLAYTFSLLNKRVVIINFDLRKPTLHTIFNISNQNGLSNYLSSSAEIDDIIFNTEYNNLDIIPAGPIPPNPSELIASNKTSNLLTTLKESYDIVIVDTPPIGVVTDSRILLSQCEVVIYVIRANYSKKEFIKSIDKFYKDKVFKSMGVVLNDVKYKNSGYGYGYGYGYYEDK